MAVYKRGKVGWYKFAWSGERIRESTKQSNRRVAEQIEAAHKTQLAKGEVGIRSRQRAPTLAEFAEQIFLPHVETNKKNKPNTAKFYRERVARLMTFPRLWSARIDAIDTADITAYVASQQF